MIDGLTSGVADSVDCMGSDQVGLSSASRYANPRFGRWLASVQELVDPWAIRYVEPAFDGDENSAFKLYCAARNEHRGIIAVAMCNAWVRQSAFRCFLQAAWEHDHRHVIAAAKTKDRLRWMFRYAAFSIPQSIPRQAVVWRGTSALSSAKARRGLSWTVSRDIACWFACRFAAKNGRPLVLRAEVQRKAIVMYSNEREEQEVVLLEPPAAVLDGSVEDWERGHDRVTKAMADANAASMVAVRGDAK